MDESRHLAMRRAHVKNKRYCTCGVVVCGNGGIASHRAMHARRGDGHWGMTYSLWCDVQAGRVPMPPPRSLEGGR